MKRSAWLASCSAATAMAVSLSLAQTQTASAGMPGGPELSDAEAVLAGARGPDPDRPWVLRTGTLETSADDFAELCEKDDGAVDEGTLRLFPDVAVDVVASHVLHDPKADLFTWSGHVRGAPAHGVDLAVTGVCSDGPIHVSGHVDQGDLDYEIIADSDGVSTVEEIDARAFPDLGDDRPHHRLDHPETTAPRAAGTRRRAEPDGMTYIDVAVGYTPNAAAKKGGELGMKAAIAVAEAQMNRALEVSGVNARVSFAHTFEAKGFTGSEDAAAMWREMSQRTTALGRQVRDVREKTYADLVTIVSDVPKPKPSPSNPHGLYTGGIGSYTGSPDAKHTTEAIYSAADVATMTSNGTLAHEIGHNLALQHDDKNEANAPLNPHYPANRGWVTPSKKFHTIMAYGSACDWKCHMIPQYSNTINKNEGEPLGDARHDNASVLRQTAPIVAAYRTPPKAAQRFSLSVQTSPRGGGTAIPATQGPYADGAQVSVTARPADGYTFTGWKLDGKTIGSHTPLAVAMTKDRQLVAEFAPVPHQYKVTPLVSPAGAGKIQLQPQQSTYMSGETVNATAVPNRGYQFQEWRVNGRQLSTSARIPLQVDASFDLVAVFARGTHTLTTKTTPLPRSGTVTVSQPGPYATGDSVVLGAKPGPYRVFTGWTVDGADAGKRIPLPLIVKRSHTVTASFACSVAARGAIDAKWRAWGAEKSNLGCPTGPEKTLKGGIVQPFEDGNIYWTKAGGAHPVRGGFLREWGKLSYERGAFGYPLTDPVQLPVSDGKPTGGKALPKKGVYQRFQGGLIVWDAATTKVTSTRL
ncbi:InlB B-repeat-containing protein [Streptomyces sp. NBC_01304]|uniref:InlB B-repeat-containing protein n=1 Tax=Streptomyces sp. NBC_01304 TaxID=2903818 RepID=UPI002E0FE547|nr:M12 family metallo-peptidase [Streptomyces sp. NBC_01304]